VTTGSPVVLSSTILQDGLLTANGITTGQPGSPAIELLFEEETFAARPITTLKRSTILFYLARSR
jgi:hypothetical protein